MIEENEVRAGGRYDYRDPGTLEPVIVLVQRLEDEPPRPNHQTRKQVVGLVNGSFAKSWALETFATHATPMVTVFMNEAKSWIPKQVTRPATTTVMGYLQRWAPALGYPEQEYVLAEPELTPLIIALTNEKK